MDKNLVITIVLAILVVVSAVQTIELVSLKNQVSDGNIALKSVTKSTGTIAAGAGSTAGSGDSGVSSSSLQDLPNMVGGC